MENKFRELVRRIKHDLESAETRLEGLERGSLEYEFDYGVMVALLVVLSDIKELKL